MSPLFSSDVRTQSQSSPGYKKEKDALRPPAWRFIAAVAIVLLMALLVNLCYYFVFYYQSGIVVPSVVRHEYFIYQTIFIVVLNGIIHYRFYKSGVENTFGFLTRFLVLLGANVAVFFVSVDIRLFPSVNELKTLYGAAGPPVELLWLSAPVLVVTCLLGIYGIPAYLKHNDAYALKQQNTADFKAKSIRLFKAFITVSTSVLLVNLLYYYFYVNLAANPSTGNFSGSEFLQMNYVSTAVSALLYMYLLDYAKNGRAQYYLMTFIITISLFLAGLPVENGQPVFDASLWFNVPTSLISLLGEMVGIPYFFNYYEGKKDQHLGNYSK